MATVPVDPAFDVAALLARERGALMSTLARLGGRDWDRPTACPGWRVRDLVSHLWSTDLGLLARLRDGHEAPLPGAPFADHTAFVAGLDRHNERWVEATRFVSPDVLVEQLRDSGPRVTTIFRHGDPRQLVERVTWAGPDPAPLWFSGARDLTERFVHQQQIRAAVGQLPYDDEEVVAAVVDTFVHAFPVGLARAPAPAGTSVEVVVTAPVARRWCFVAGDDGWRIAAPGAEPAPSASLRTDAEGFWRLLAGAMTPAEQVQRVDLRGTPTLFAALRDTRAVLV